MRISVVGLGYVGLVTSAGFAEWGHDVTGVEASPSRLHALLQGRVPFHEPGLDDIVVRGQSAGRLKFSSPGAQAVMNADVVITAVGTHDGNGGWQTDTMRQCLEGIVAHMADHAVLVVRSTLPPEFIRELPAIVDGLRAGAKRDPIPVLTNPEFTREGRAVHDFMHPERVVIGVASDPRGRGAQLLAKAYALVEGPMLTMSAVDASFAKLGSNLFLATKISFANELAALCQAHGANITRVVEAMALDSRIGGQFLRPGVGFGGSCLPHQVSMTARAGIAEGVPTPLISAVEEVNTHQRHRFVELLAEALGRDGLSGVRVALLGLTFKPDTDDLRDAPALTIARLLIERGATVVAYDPMPTARLRAGAIVDGLELVDSAIATFDGADAAGLVTEWSEFAQINWADAASRMASPVMVDGRNFLDPAIMRINGFRYLDFGRHMDEVSSAYDISLPIAPRPEALPAAQAVESAERVVVG